MLNQTQIKKTGAALLAYLPYIVFTLVLAGCYAKGNEKPAPPVEVSHAIPVDVSVIKATSLNEEVEITGSLSANQQVDIVSELTRKIISVHVKEGAYVQSGQLLFQLDDADLQAQLEKLKQQEKLALLNEARMRDLITHEAVVQQDYDQSFTNLKVLQAQIAEVRVAIRKTRIVAPFSGQIGILQAYPGAIVSTNTVLTNIQDNSVIKLDFLIPEKYSNIITNGSIQKFSVASDEKQYSAKVVARGSQLDANTRTLLIRAVSNNPGRILLPGQSARIHLALHSSNDALMLSSQALMPTSQGYNIYVIKNNHVQLSPIEIGQRGPSAVEVVKGANIGDTIVTSNLLRLTPGTEVKVVNLKS